MALRTSREQTDRSLRGERDAADGDALEGVMSVDEIADAVISRARARADEVLAGARALMDRSLTSAALGASQAVRSQRLMEDAAVRKERSTADAVLRTERRASLVPLGVAREHTDEDLLRERVLTDNTHNTRDAFMGVVSHELRNMMSAVAGFAELLESAAARTGQSEQLLHAQLIQRAGARMNRLIGDLVDVASIHAGTLNSVREPLDPTLVVREAMDTYRPLAKAKNVRLNALVAGHLCIAEIDPARILQVLINLLSNAIKFSAEGGEVTLKAECNDSELRFSVQDSGPGIADHELRAVFDRFHQVKENDHRGLGVGLYISRCIVLEHGGRIWAESVLGEGATFNFTLPCSK